MSEEEEIKRTGAALARGKSRQDYGTPREFIAAVERRFGRLTIDLAASRENHKAPKWFTEAQNSLSLEWPWGDELCWLNPPFDNIAPWAKKCAESNVTNFTRILFLVPASVGSNWFRDHVHRRALVLALNGRLTFEGETQPYPKDCILCCYGYGIGFDTWTWKE